MRSPDSRWGSGRSMTGSPRPCSAWPVPTSTRQAIPVTAFTPKPLPRPRRPPWCHRGRGGGTAGASARREYERRAARRDTRIRTAHPRLGGLISRSAISRRTSPRGIAAPAERMLASRLDALGEQDVLLLHDRGIPRSRANIDHIAVSAAGVFVIDAKRYRGRPQLRVQGGVLRPRTETLTVGHRDGTKWSAASPLRSSGSAPCLPLAGSPRHLSTECSASWKRTGR